MAKKPSTQPAPEWVGRSARSILLAALFCTAFSSLAYELVWTRKLSYVFGSTALAASSVLSVFMAGLAVGSLRGGEILERRERPYRFLGLLLVAIGIACILTLFAVQAVDRAQVFLLGLSESESTFWVKVALFLLSSAVLFVPTFLIGVAFPAIVQLYHSSSRLVGESVGRCYWVDTLGASLGMLIAAFWALPTMGLLRTSLAASAINIVAGGAILLLARKEKPREVTAPASRRVFDSDVSPLKGRITAFLFFLSGFAALVLEVIWIKHFSQTYGTGMHAFAIVVVTFLLGLSIGSVLYELFLKNVKNQIQLFAGIELLIGASAVIITALFPYLELWFLDIYFSTDTFGAFATKMALVCLGLLAVPTTLMGMTLPALCAVVASDEHVGRDFGALYAFNSFGAVAGSFCAGFLIVPTLGIYNGAFVGCGVYFFIAIAFLATFVETRQKLTRYALTFGVVAIVSLIGFFQVRKSDHMYSGVFYSAIHYGEDRYEEFLRTQESIRKLMRYRETGVYGQVAAYGHARDMVLRSNGRIDSSTSSDTRSYQLMIGHIPSLLHNNVKSALNIGLGGGWTVRALVDHESLQDADCVEINPLMIEVNQNVFFVFNDDILNHPKVNTFVNDGRNFVEHTNTKYDIIISEPPEFWFSGVSALFTREFYDSTKRVLNDGGMFCQWFPRYEIAERDYLIALNTIKNSFAYAYEFNMAKITGDPNYESFLVIGSDRPIDVAGELGARQAEWERLKTVKTQRSGRADYFLGLIQQARTAYNRDDDALSEYIAGETTIHTDDWPVLEFHAARDRFRKFRSAE